MYLVKKDDDGVNIFLFSQNYSALCTTRYDIMTECITCCKKCDVFVYIYFYLK